MDRLFGYILGGLAIAAAIVGVFLLYSSTTSDTNISQTQSELTQIKSQMDMRYLRQPGRFGTAVFSASNLIAFGIAPSSTIDGTSAMVDAWGGAITISGNNTSFFVDYTNVSDKACDKILGEFSPQMGIVAVYVAGSEGGLDGATGYTLPVNDTDTRSLCSNDPDAIRFEMQ